MGKSCLTEISELMCATGGKITVMNHGQQSELTKTNVRNADSRLMNMINPLVDFEKFKSDIEKQDLGDFK